jgi:hypothetical protein
MMAVEQPTRRRPPFPWFGRFQLWAAIGLAGIIVGSFLPWWQTFLGPRWGLDTYGIWTMWAAAVGLAGALSLRRNLFAVLPLVAGVITLGVIIWVGLDGVDACRPAADGSTPCQPGIGLTITGAGAIHTIFTMIRYHISPGLTPSRS